MKRLFWPASSWRKPHAAPSSSHLGLTTPTPPHPRYHRTVATLAILAIGSAAFIGAAGSSAARNQAAHAARSLNGTATAHLHLIKANGSQLYEEGPVTGALPGSMRAVLTTGTVFAGSFTIRTTGGSIEGHGRATTHGTGRYQSFNGSITVNGGTGRYSHAHGHTELSGTFDRRTYAMVIHTTGTLSY